MLLGRNSYVASDAKVISVAPGKEPFFSQNVVTVFDLITGHTPISAPY